MRSIKSVFESVKVKLIKLTLLLLISWSGVNGQNPLSLYFLENVPQSATINPAMIPNAKFYIGFPVFNSVYTGVNFELTGADLIQEHNGRYVTFTHADFDYSKLYGKIGKAANFSSYQTITPLLFGFKTKGGYFTFGWTEKLSESLAVPKDVFSVFDKGFPDGSHFDFSKLGASAQYYREFLFGYSFEPVENLRIGVNAKFLQGLASLKTRVEQFTLNTGLDEWKMNIHGSTSLSAPVSVSYDDDGIPSIDSIPENIGDFINKAAFNFSNPGFAFDLGMVYELSEKWNFSASLTDVGMIHWGGDDLHTFYADGDYSFTGIDVNNDNVDSLDNVWDDILDSIKTNVDFTHGSEKFVTATGPKLYLGAKLNLNDYFNVGIVSRTLFSKNDFRQDFNLSAGFNVKKFLTTSVNYSISINGANALGAGLGLRLWPVQFYAAVDYLPVKMYQNITIENSDDPGNPVELPSMPAKLDNLSVMFGVNLLFGTKENDTSKSSSAYNPPSKKRKKTYQKRKKKQRR